MMLPVATIFVGLVVTVTCDVRNYGSLIVRGRVSLEIVRLLGSGSVDSLYLLHL